MATTWRRLLTPLLLLGACAGPPSAAAQEVPTVVDTVDTITTGPAPPCLAARRVHPVTFGKAPRLRFGISPLVETGQVGNLPAKTVPEDIGRTMAALDRLRPDDGGPFVIRLQRTFLDEGDASLARTAALVDRYAASGYEIQVVLRYRPAGTTADIAGWTDFVRRAVQQLGSRPAVRLLQVTNELNLWFNAQTSDGAARGAREALVEGIVAADDEAERLGLSHLGIGFNWFYRVDPITDAGFWRHLRDAGERFTDAVDWVGVDTYPGTFVPPVGTVRMASNWMRRSLASARCFMRSAGIPDTVPLHVDENGWPTYLLRSPARQAQMLKAMVEVTDRHRAAYNVTDYRWFNLRDGNSSERHHIQQNLGLLFDDYREKPAFEVLRRYIASRSR